MAVSSNFTTSNQYVWYWLQVDLTSQDIALNRSYIRVRIWAQRTAGYETYGSGTATFYNYTGGQYTATIYPSQKITSTPVCLFDQNHYVNHDAAGNASPSFGAAINIPSVLSSSAQYHTFTLPQIQRAASISSVNSGSDFGSQITANWSGVSAYTYQVTFSAGSNSHTITTAAGASSASYTPPLSWLAAFPDTVSTSVKVELKTFYNSSQVGSTSSYMLYQSAPSSVVPTISAPTTSHVDIFPTDPVPAGWGYVQTRSGITVNASSAGAYGSTITSMSIGGGGYTNAAVTVSNGAGSRTFGVLNTSGTNTFTITVTDSRGRSATRTVNVTVNAYARPQLSNVLTQRATSGGVQDANGTYALGKATYAFSAVGSNAVVRNVNYRELNATTWTDASVSFNSGTAFLIGGGFDVLKSYEIAYIIEDQFNTVIYIDTLSVATPILHFKKGGLMAAIFKRVGTFVGLDIGSDVNIDGDLTVGGENLFLAVHPVNSLFFTLDSTNPGTLYGGTWVAIAQGRVLIGVNVNDSDFNTAGKTGGSKDLQQHNHSYADATPQAHTHGRGNLTTRLTVTSGGYMKYQYESSGSWTSNYQLAPSSGSGGANSTGYSDAAVIQGVTASATNTSDVSRATGNTGSGASQNMPPYLACYIWQRTA